MKKEDEGQSINTIKWVWSTRVVTSLIWQIEQPTTATSPSLLHTFEKKKALSCLLLLPSRTCLRGERQTTRYRIDFSPLYTRRVIKGPKIK
uniref:Uncharacterized protein n=1 Tax=Amphimedon queenslandica TaxID=400682 RepID=A0A1X7VDZ4_AMPQE